MSPRMAHERTSESVLSSKEGWDVAAAKYDLAVGRASSVAAARLIQLARKARPLDSSEAGVLEFACGTGSTTLLLAQSFPELPIVATDISSGMLDILRSAAGDYNIQTKIIDFNDPLESENELDHEFTHIVCTMALGLLKNPLESMTRWKRLLAPNGVMAIGVWDFEEVCGPYEIWVKSVRRVDPKFDPLALSKNGQWSGAQSLREGFKQLDLRDICVETLYLGFSMGTEDFMNFWWESNNPMPRYHTASYSGSLGPVKAVMRRIVDEEYDGGLRIPLYGTVAVGKIVGG